jgi:asparagine synthase (glutamine-hydrolysing)
MTGEGADEIVGGYFRHAAACFAGPFCGLLGLDGGDADPRASRLRRMLYFEQCSRLPELLERGERMAASAGLEARAPFLDHRLAEHVSALPDALRVRGLATKWIVRQAVRRLVPAAGGAPRKGGFGMAAGDWLRGELRETLLDHLRGSGSAVRAHCNPAVLDRALDEHLAGRGRHEKLLWTLLNLEIWHRSCLSA